jgi:hypothetical protein
MSICLNLLQLSVQPRRVHRRVAQARLFNEPALATYLHSGPSRLAAHRVDLFKLEDDQTKAKFSVVVFDCFELLNVSRAVSAVYKCSEDL